MRKTGIMLTTAALAVLTLTTTARADFYLKQKQTVGKNSKTIETWTTPAGYRIDDGDTSLILPTKSKRPLILMHNTKNFVQYTRSISDDPSLKDMSIIVEERPQTKKIGKWNCIKHVITVSGPEKAILRQELWTTEDIKLSDENAELYQKYILGPLAGRSDAFVEELKKVRGVEVMSVTYDLSDLTAPPEKSELVEISQTKAPEGILDIPKGYSQKE